MLFQINNQTFEVKKGEYENLGKNGDITKYTNPTHIQIIQKLQTLKTPEARKALRNCFNFYLSTNKTTKTINLD